jgi:PRTRC genetic system protein E
MFKQIEKMLESGGAMVLTVAKEADGKLKVAVRPVGEFKNSVLGQGITVAEKAEVLDDEFAAVLSTYEVAHKSLKEQVEDRVRVMEAAAAAEKAAKSEAIKKGVSTKAPTKAATGVGAAKQPTPAARGQQDDDDGEDAGVEVGGAGGELSLF